MSESPTTTTPSLAGGRPIQELVLAVATGSHRDRAMPFAAKLAEQWDLPIRVVHVSDSVGSTDSELDAIVEELRPWYPHARIESTHIFGEDPAKAIAGDLSPQSLAVLSTEHADGWRFKGSVGDALASAAGIPVLLVGPKARHPRVSGEIVVGVDGSAAAESALESAVGLAKALKRRLWLVCVVPQPVAGTPDQYPTIGRYLQELAELYDPIASTRWEVIQNNDPVDAITAFAERRKAGFLVASTVGHADRRSHSMRSITMGLVSAASCPVLVSVAAEPPVLE